ncbi:transcriptional regulator, lysR family protein [Cupriavidus basilensis OR16]|uniref:Transcriptional regulator, lysR family protein n=1 Tax=Cupriavidus basilensis OR16 TaxID=1127483 RepID=H1S6M7_9BURK|nr:LysR substrate-binding domain-containing protein [Cupriavidus basilensis]EHP41688.1 transcriptional regulator, lysR family protein [Cupriavidus basilensis OR16]
MSPSLKQLRYFVEIVDAGSFSLAAERLFIAQSALSRQIKEMEGMLQVVLLVRKPRHVETTPAGRAFLQAARRILAELAEASAQARQVERGEQGTVRLLHSSSVPLTPACTAVLREYQAKHPGIRFEISQASSEQQAMEIEEGRADLGLAREPLLRRLPGVEAAALYEEHLQLVVSTAHPLAHAHRVALESLREEPFVSLPHPDRGGLSHRVAQCCLERGFYPRAAAAISRKQSQLALVEAGFGVALMPASLARLAPPGVRCVPLADAGCDTRVLLLSRRDAAPAAAALAQSLRAALSPRSSPQ